MSTQSQEADEHDGAAETRRDEGIHDSSYGFNRLPSLFRSEQSKRIYSMRAEGTEQFSRISGEKTEPKLGSAPSSPKMILFTAVNMAVFLNCVDPQPGQAAMTNMAAIGLPHGGGIFDQQ
jgi:hypothetical protein